jgi:hypothetical protein
VSQNCRIFTTNFKTDSNAANRDHLESIEPKYSASTGANGTPVVDLNGVQSDLDSDSGLSEWYAEIDALVNETSDREMIGERLFLRLFISSTRIIIQLRIREITFGLLVRTSEIINCCALVAI